MLNHSLTAVPATNDQTRVDILASYSFEETITPALAPPGTRANTWCLPWYGGDDNNDDYNGTENDSSEANYSPSSNPEAGLPTKTLAAEKLSRPQTEKTPMMATNANSGAGWDTFSCSEADDLKPQSLMAQPRIRTLLFIEGLYSLSYSGFSEVYSLWSLSTMANGGLDLSTKQIGQVFLSCGLMLTIFDMCAVPNITPRLGIGLFQRIGSVFEVLTFFSFPVLSTVNAAGLPVAFMSLMLLFLYYVCSNSFYIAIALAINNATGPSRRGELNGISMALTSVARSISPVVFSTMFAFSIDGSHPFPFDYHLVFYLIGTMRLVVAFMAWNRIQDTEVMRAWNVINDAEGMGVWSKLDAKERVEKPTIR